MREYHKVIKEYLENKTIYQEINIVRKYYKINPKQYIVLIRLEGIKGDIDTYIDDINIYFYLFHLPLASFLH